VLYKLNEVFWNLQKQFSGTVKWKDARNVRWWHKGDTTVRQWRPSTNPSLFVNHLVVVFIGSLW